MKGRYKISGNRQGTFSFFCANHLEYTIQGPLFHEFYHGFPFLHTFITFVTQPFDCEFLQLKVKNIYILKKNK
jgi:hypothetical protein